jgi:hypothetical protein
VIILPLDFACSSFLRRLMAVGELFMSHPHGIITLGKDKRTDLQGWEVWLRRPFPFLESTLRGRGLQRDHENCEFLLGEDEINDG